MNTIKKLHIDLEAKTIGVEFQKGDVRGRHIIDFKDLPPFRLDTLAEEVQKKLDADVTEVSDGRPEKLTSNLHQVRSLRQEHGALQKSIKLDSNKLTGLKKQIAVAEAKKASAPHT